MTTVRLLKNGVEAFPAMLASIDGASASIAVEMYIVADDGTGREFRDHLTAASRRGVRVMVVVDAWGCVNLPDAFWDGLRAAGGMVRAFHPLAKGLLPFRNHRKLLLIDDCTAYIGGMNIADKYYRGYRGEPPWRDNMLELTGAEVARLRGSFSRMWTRTESPLRRLLLRLRHGRRRPAIGGGRVRFLESGPEDPFRPVRSAYLQVIQGAAKTIDLAMGYFYAHGRILRALRRAVRRGVRVRMLFSQKTDVAIARWAARGLYGRLLRAGVEIWEYRPAMLHAKLTIADDTLIAGSANLDIRSGGINYELVAVVTDRTLADAARADYEDDLRQSVRVTLEEWRRRPLIQRVKEQLSYCLLARVDLFIARMELARRLRGVKGQRPPEGGGEG